MLGGRAKGWDSKVPAPIEMEPDREQREAVSQVLLGPGAEDVPTVEDPAGSMTRDIADTVPEDASRTISPLGIEVAFPSSSSYLLFLYSRFRS